MSSFGERVEAKNMSKRTWAAGKPRKKPNYNSSEITRELLQAAVSVYTQKGNSGRHPSLQSMVEQLAAQGYGALNPIKVRKLLITAGVYESDTAGQVLKMHKSGRSVDEIGERLQLSRSSVHSYLPYEKIIYKLDETPGGDISVGAERQRLYKCRKAAVERLKNEPGEDNLWAAIVVFSKYPFQTSKGLQFTYTVKGNEIFFSRREKSISKATVNVAYKNAVSLGGVVSGPKKLGTFGASYLYPVFVRLGIIQTGEYE